MLCYFSIHSDRRICCDRTLGRSEETKNPYLLSLVAPALSAEADRLLKVAKSLMAIAFPNSIPQKYLNSSIAPSKCLKCLCLLDSARFKWGKNTVTRRSGDRSAQNACGY